MTLTRALVLAAAAAATMPLAAAAENRPVPRSQVGPLERMSMHVNSLIFPELVKLVPAETALGLVIVAEQAAIAASCPAYDLDATRFQSVMTRLLAPVQALVEEGKENLPLDMVMNGYSAIKGGALARAGYDPAAFCAASEGFIEDLSQQASEKPDEALLVVAIAG